MKTQKFGVEIEMKGITRREGAKLLAEFFHNHSNRFIGDGYDIYGADDSEGRTWKFVSDASVEGGCELVTPILRYDDIETLQEIVRLVRNNGARIDGQCGIHVHIGVPRIKASKVANLSNFFYAYEDIIYHALKIKSRRQRFCRKTDERFIERLNEDKPRTKDEFADCWYESQNASCGRGHHYNESRYHALNLHAWFTKGTVEFRVFNSTLHAGRVKAYIQFCLALVAKAKEMRGALPIKIQTDNEYQSFKECLERIGLEGDEFKTCRFHMLKVLKERQERAVGNN